MRRWGTLVLAVALLWAAAVSAGAADPDPPSVSGDGVYLERPGSVPAEIGFDENGRLDTAVPPGSVLYFAIDNAPVAGSLAGYSAHLRFAEGEECVGPADIRYAELFGADGRGGVYRFAVRVPFFDANYEELPTVTATVRVDTSAYGHRGEFRFTAVVQEGPLEGQIADVAEPEGDDADGLFTFSPDDDYTRLHFGEAASFFVPTPNQRPLNISRTDEVPPAVRLLYPEGDFLALTFEAGPVFGRVGTLTLYAPESFYLYEITPSGLVSPAFVYNTSAGGFAVETRRLGSYLLSNLSLPADVFLAVKQNPPTGARQKP